MAPSSDMYSDLLVSQLLKQHKIDSVEHSATALLLRGSGTCWDHGKDFQFATDLSI